MKKNHHKTYIFLFYMVFVIMRVEYTERMFLCCNVAAQNKVEFKIISPASGNGSNGVMRLAIGKSNHANSFVAVTSPKSKDFIRKFRNSCRVRSAKADNAHRPVNNSGLDIFKAFENNFFPCNTVRYSFCMFYIL